MSFRVLKSLRILKGEIAKKGCHAEALEACAQGIVNYALVLIHGV
jgi:hypothetical protein